MTWNVETLLVPTDGSELSKLAYRPAFEIAKLKDAEVIGLYVIELPGIIINPSWEEQREKEEEEIAKKFLSELEKEGKKDNIKIKTRIEKGNVADTILKVAEESDVDLIVMGTHGRSGTKRLLGSVADAVVRGSHCPVMVIRELKRE